jgi:hypothetical protein
MNDLTEKLTKLLMESYDKGVADTIAASIDAAEAAVVAAVKAEREACAKVCEDINAEYEGEDVLATWCAAAIRARGQA